MNGLHSLPTVYSRVAIHSGGSLHVGERLGTPYFSPTLESAPPYRDDDTRRALHDSESSTFTDTVYTESYVLDDKQNDLTSETFRASKP